MAKYCIVVMSYQRVEFLRDSLGSALSAADGQDCVVLISESSRSRYVQANRGHYRELCSQIECSDVSVEWVQWLGIFDSHDHFTRLVSHVESKAFDYWVLLHDDDRLDANYFSVISDVYASLAAQGRDVSAVGVNAAYIDSAGLYTGIIHRRRRGRLEVLTAPCEVLASYTSPFDHPPALSGYCFKIGALGVQNLSPPLGKYDDLRMIMHLSKGGVAFTDEVCSEIRRHNNQDSSQFDFKALIAICKSFFVNFSFCVKILTPLYFLKVVVGQLFRRFGLL